MHRVILAALVAALSFPALAADPPAGLECIALRSWMDALGRTGQAVLGIAPAPYTARPTLYWRTAAGLVIMAPIVPAANGSGPCVAYERAVPLGGYAVGQAS